MRLHENISLYTDAIQFTAQQMNLPPEYVEKDYWVTFTLYNIFKNEIGKETVFKGGTALSKCIGLIQRFSEDIDLVVLRKETETENQLKNKIKKISKTTRFCGNWTINIVEYYGIRVLEKRETEMVIRKTMISTPKCICIFLYFFRAPHNSYNPPPQFT